MQAYEFFAKPENGVIPIPEELKNRITSNVRIIVLENKPSELAQEGADERPKSDLLLAPTLDTRGWTFDREEANER